MFELVPCSLSEWDRVSVLVPCSLSEWDRVSVLVPCSLSEWDRVSVLRHGENRTSVRTTLLAVVAKDLVENLGRVRRRVGLDAQPLHRGCVVVHVVALVQVEGAGQLLDVDHVR